MTNHFLLGYILILLWGLCSAYTYERPRRDEMETTREEVLASRKRRSEQLEKLLSDAKERLNDHNNNIKLVTDEEKGKLEKKIEVFSKKLESMAKEPDERDIERLIHRERLIKERHFERRKLREEL